MKIIFLVLFITIFSFSGMSQNTGLYGKRTFIEFNTLSYMPMFSWLLSDPDGYSANGNVLTLKKDLINYGFHFTVGRAGKKNTAVSLEIGYDFSNISAPDNLSKSTVDQWGYEYTAYPGIKHERFDLQTLTIMPKIEFTSQGGTLPVGLNHQIGFGYTSSKLKNKDYKYQIISDQNVFTSEELANFNALMVDYDQKYTGFTLLYAFNIRTPLSKSFMINYGIRYTLNLRNYFSDYIGVDQSFYEQYEVQNDISRNRISNFLTFNLGLTFAL